MSITLQRKELIAGAGRKHRPSARPEQPSTREAHEIAAVAVRRAERFGDPATLGHAQRVLADCGPRPDIDVLEESVRLPRDTPHRWQYLRSLTELGTALADAGHDARAVLTDALALADDCGALNCATRSAEHTRSQP